MRAPFRKVERVNRERHYDPRPEWVLKLECGHVAKCPMRYRDAIGVFDDDYGLKMKVGQLPPKCVRCVQCLAEADQ